MNTYNNSRRFRTFCMFFSDVLLVRHRCMRAVTDSDHLRHIPELTRWGFSSTRDESSGMYLGCSKLLMFNVLFDRMSWCWQPYFGISHLHAAAAVSGKVYRIYLYSVRNIRPALLCEWKKADKNLLQYLGLTVDICMNTVDILVLHTTAVCKWLVS